MATRISTSPSSVLELGQSVVAKALKGRSAQSVGKAAIAWTLSNPAVTGAIVGGRNGKQVEGIIGASEFRLNRQEHELIKENLKIEANNLRWIPIPRA